MSDTGSARPRLEHRVGVADVGYGMPCLNAPPLL